MSREEMRAIEEWLDEEVDEYEDVELDEYRESYQDYISSYIF